MKAIIHPVIFSHTAIRFSIEKLKFNRQFPRSLVIKFRVCSSRMPVKILRDALRQVRPVLFSTVGNRRDCHREPHQHTATAGNTVSEFSVPNSEYLLSFCLSACPNGVGYHISLSLIRFSDTYQPDIEIRLLCLVKFFAEPRTAL